MTHILAQLGALLSVLLALLICTMDVNAQGTWNYLLHDDSTQYRGISFLNADTGWISFFKFPNTKGILFTTDGGARWDTLPASIPSSTFYHDRMLFVDRLNGWSWSEGSRIWGSFPPSEEGELYHTTDGGQSWIDIREGLPEHPSTGAKFYPESLWFFDSDTGWAAGRYAGLARTTDGGLTWDDTHIAWTPEGWRFFADITFADAMHGWAVGGNHVRLIAHTTDGGETWLGNYLGKPAEGYNLHALSFPTNTFGYAVDAQYGAALYTRDGGQAWIEDTTILDISESLSGLLTDVVFVDSLRGWISGKGYVVADQRTYGFILSTTDGGRSWNTDIFDSVLGLREIVFPDPNAGYAVGPKGVLKYQRTTGARSTDNRFDFPVAISLVPNPASGILKIETNAPGRIVSIAIFDVRGKEIYSREVDESERASGQAHCDLSGLPSGYYQCRIQFDSGGSTAPLLIVR